MGTKRVRTGVHIGRNSAGVEKFPGAYGSGLPETGTDRGYAGEDGREEVPAWVCAEGCPVALMDEQSAGKVHGAGHARAEPGDGTYTRDDGWGNLGVGLKGFRYGDTGGPSRFFHCFEADPFVYQAKASRKDRGEGNRHPTVKSTALMRHLCRLIAAPGDLVLDMFAGSGSTGVAALSEGMRFIGIEQDAESVKTARRRLRAPRPAAAVTPPRRAAA